MKIQIALAFAALTSSSLSTYAQMGPPMKAGEVSHSLETLYIYQNDAGLDSGGDVSLQTLRVQGGSKWGLKNGHSLGFTLAAGVSDYSFSSPTAFGGQAPWNDIHKFGLNLQYNYLIDRTQSLFFMPSFEFTGEDGVDFGDGLTWGGIAGYSKRFSPTLTLGIGGAVFGGLEDTTGFPIILVYWQFAEDWRLSNPFRPGPSGPAGLEVIYSGVETWEFSLGGGYRSNRFALDDSGVAANGFGENDGTVLFLRGTHSVSQNSNLDLYFGTLVGGELNLEDSNGDRLTSVDYDASLVLAVAYSLSF